MGDRVTKSCKGCNAIMYDVNSRKRFCDSCVKQHKSKYNRKYRSRERELQEDGLLISKPVIQRKPTCMTRLDARIAEADRLGMSYGKYAAMLYAEESKLKRRIK